MQHDRHAGPLPLDAGLWDPTEDGLMEDTHDAYLRRTSLLAQARRHPRAVAGGVLAVFLILAGVVAAQRLIGSQARPATGLRAWRERLDDWRGRLDGWRDGLGDQVGDLRDTLQDRWRGLDLPSRVRGLDLSDRAGPALDRAARLARDHAGTVGTLAAVTALIGAVAVALYDQQARD